MKAVQKLKSVIALFGAAFLVLCSGGAAPATAALAYSDELTAYDRTAIEDDLRDIDVSAYVKNKNGTHCLMDEVGFIEYAYSESSMIATNYYGIYFYVYNPTEKEVSTRAGANVVNMAIAYGADGKPTDYANLPLTLLDCTDNHRFYKFRLTDSAAVYRRAKEYAAAHGGERRYDVAGIQLWFAGEQNATDSKEEKTHRGGTYYRSGYAAGCGDSIKTSTLEGREETLDTVTLDIKHTFYRTKTSDLGEGHQVQIDSVYFSVPKRFIDEYGKLQRIKAEWYEYKTSPIVVTSSSDFYYAAEPYIGVDTTKEGEFGYIQDCYSLASDGHSPTDTSGPFDPIMPNLGYSLWNAPTKTAYLSNGILLIDFLYAEGYEHGMASLGRGEYLRDIEQDKYYQNGNAFESLYYLFHTKDWCSIEDYDPLSDIEEMGGVSRTALENYIYNYTRTYHSGKIEIGEKVLSADLFEDDIDESRKLDTEYGKIQKGYSFYDFDVDTDLQEIVTYNPSNHSFLENWRMFDFWSALFGNYRKDVEDSETIPPIMILSEQEMAGSNEQISNRLKVHIDDVPLLKEEYKNAVTVESSNDEEKVVVLFHFAVSDYYSEYLAITQNEIGEKESEKFYLSVPDSDIHINEKGYYYPVNVSSKKNDGYGKAYFAQESVFFDFDIIQLTFNKGGEFTVIPVVADPIDIIDPITPPWYSKKEDFWAFVWAMCGVLGGLIVSIIGVSIYEKNKAREGK